MKPTIDRRDFIKASLASAGVAAFGTAALAQAGQDVPAYLKGVADM